MGGQKKRFWGNFAYPLAFRPEMRYNVGEGNRLNGARPNMRTGAPSIRKGNIMTEKELLQHAKGYIDNLANGINPLTGEPVAETDIVNNVRISRCLFYVSGILDKVLSGNKQIVPRDRRLRFSVSPEKLEAFPYASSPIYVSEIANRLSALADDGSGKISAYRITKWLLANGFFEEQTDSSGKPRRVVTEAGKEIGLYQVERESAHGKFLATLYPTEAQRFIVDNLEAILAE